MNNKNCNKIIGFIVPYFGKLPNTFQVFLDSAAYNLNYDWILFTDDRSFFNYPSNVQVHYCSFSDMKDRVQRMFDFPVALESPKKLCDYKPAYGYIFSEELKNYRFWGYCDIDMVLGNLCSFLTAEYLEEYDRIFTLGHMSVYRNTAQINTLFMKELNNSSYMIRSYKDIYSTNENKCFDEWIDKNVNINLLSEQEHIRWSGDWFMADLLPHRSAFYESFYNLEHHMWSRSESSVIVVKQGPTLNIYQKTDNGIEAREVIYSHIQKRELSIKKYDSNKESFIIIPNSVISVDSISDDLILEFIRKGSIKRVLKIDEIQWSLQLTKAKWISHFKKLKKILFNQA